MKVPLPPWRSKLRFFATVSAFVSLSASAQVFSDNIVGYVNVTLPAGYIFLANPLDAGDDRLSTLMPGAPEGSRAYQWDVTNQAFLEPSLKTSSNAWSVDYEFPLGRGFVVYSSSQWTNTFVGDVRLGSQTNFVAGSNKFSLLGSKIPVTGPLSEAFLAYPGTDGDEAHLFRSDLQQYTDASTYLDGHGWFDPKGIEGTGGPVLPVARSFFVQNPGPDKLWIQQLNLSDRAEPSGADRTAPGPVVRHISISGQTVTLQVQNPDGGGFNVQFSTDGTEWTTLARNETGAEWSGTLPHSVQGCFRLSKP